MGEIIPQVATNLQGQVASALEEDIGSGDISALLLPDKQCSAAIFCNQQAVICGQDWVNEVYRQLDSQMQIEWRVNEGESVKPGTCCARLTGPMKALLTGERAALNFLQLLSGTATTTRDYVRLLDGTRAQLLDTRKTIPGLRSAQKYAVLCGGGQNHRMGLFDALLIKENHLSAGRSMAAMIADARRRLPGIKLEIEVENLAELESAIAARPDVIMLDDFELDEIEQAVQLNAGRIKLEVSGGVDKGNLQKLAATGVDYISVGALTKNVLAVDFSLRVTGE